MSELGDKLGRFREEPPEGMFERIEQTLLAGGIIAEEPKVVVVPLWRRPIFRGVAAALVAASICLAVIVTGGRQELEQMGGVVAQMVDIEAGGDNDSSVDEASEASEANEASESVVMEHSAEAVSDTGKGEDMSLMAKTENPSGVKSAVEATLRGKMTEKLSAEVTTTTTTGSEWLASADVATSKVSAEQVESAEEGVTSVVGTAKESSSGALVVDNSSAVESSDTSKKGSLRGGSSLLESATRRHTTSRRNESELEEYWRSVMAADQSSKLSDRPIQIALYTANMGVNQGDVKVNNISNSQLLVRENMQLDGSTYLSPMMVQEQRVDRLEHSMPVTIGVALSLPLNDWLSAESGLLYTSLNSRGESNGTMSNYVRTRSMDYVGIPLALRLDVVDIGDLTLYGRLGMTAEVCVAAKDKLYLDGSLNQTTGLKEFDRFTCSLDATAGVNYALWNNLGLFGEVGCTYWKAPDNYPENYRTLHPLRMTTRLGVRFDFN